MTPTTLSPAAPSPSGRGSKGLYWPQGAPRAPGAEGCSTADKACSGNRRRCFPIDPNENNWHIIFKYYIFFQFIYL